jgi:hypothetical protein
MGTRLASLARVGAALFAIAVAAVASAHHSGAAYDGSKTLRIEGVVTSWRFANPHCSLEIKARDAAGQEIAWSFEGNPAGMLQALGYRRNTFAPGTPVTVIYNPMRDGKAGGGRLVGAVLADGSTVGQVPTP